MAHEGPMLELGTKSSRTRGSPLSSAGVPLRWLRVGVGLWWVVVVWTGTGGGSLAEDWPQWLGPQRDAVWREAGIMESFPAGGPPLRWKTPIGSGYSGPAVADGRVFVMDRIKVEANPAKAELLNKADSPINANFERRLLPGTERVVCLDESDGRILWTHDYDCPYTTAGDYATGPRVTPTVSDGRVYTLGAEGHLLCLDAKTGKVIWARDFQKDFGIKVPMWGFAAHPLIDGDQLICVVGGQGTTAVAFDRKTGRELWRALDSKEPGYCPPTILNVGRKRQVIIWHGEAINALHPETGAVYWSVPLKATFGMAIAPPVAEGNSIFIMSFSRQSWCLRVAEDGLSAEVAWQGNTRRGIDGAMNRPFIQDGRIYGCGHSGRFLCARLEDGGWLWNTYQPSTGERPADWANVFMVQHRDRFFLANDLGDLIIAKLSPAGYTEISRAHLIDPTHTVSGRRVVWSHPAFANGSVYLRNDQEIRSYSLAAPAR